MPSAVLISNPSASQFTGGLFREVVSTLSTSFDLTTKWPTSPVETARKAADAAQEGFDVVFAMGGDGVAHHVANSLVGTDTALGLIPAGTTNVLTRILGVPLKPLVAARSAASFTPIPTRMVRVIAETASGPKTRYATFSLGIGFDADVVSIAESRPYAKLRFGGIHYASTAIGRLLSTWRTQKPHLRLTCDGDRFDGVVALTQVHRPYTYFGRVPLHLTDEVIDGVATLAASSLGLVRSSEIFTRAALGRKHREATGIRLWTEYASLVVEAEPATPFHADGELLGTAEYLEITPAENAILVLRPTDQPSSL
ncbi:MAG: diacylglycerol kinase family lipid kinase [Acidimicrobiia bacterium]|nr:MAG: diacylglycerol kinase family lipid kinase [Acidimicrobiia bacterium]